MPPTAPCERPDVDRLLEDVARSLAADFDPESLAGLPLPHLDDACWSSGDAGAAQAAETLLADIAGSCGPDVVAEPLEDDSSPAHAYVPLEPAGPRRSRLLPTADEPAPASPTDACHAPTSPQPAESGSALRCDAFDAPPLLADEAGRLRAADGPPDAATDDDDFGAGLELESDEAAETPERQTSCAAAGEPAARETTPTLVGDGDVLGEGWDSSDTVVLHEPFAVESRSPGDRAGDAAHGSAACDEASCRCAVPDLEESVARLAAELLDLAERVDVSPRAPDDVFRSDADDRDAPRNATGSSGRDPFGEPAATDDACSEPWALDPLDAHAAREAASPDDVPRAAAGADEAGIAAVAWNAFVSTDDADTRHDDDGPAAWDAPSPTPDAGPSTAVAAEELPWARAVDDDSTETLEVVEALPVESWEPAVPSEPAVACDPVVDDAPCATPDSDSDRVPQGDAESAATGTSEVVEAAAVVDSRGAPTVARRDEFAGASDDACDEAATTAEEDEVESGAWLADGAPPSGFAGSNDRTAPVVVGLGLVLGMGAAIVALWSPFAHDEAGAAAVSVNEQPGAESVASARPAPAARVAVVPGPEDDAPDVQHVSSEPAARVEEAPTVAGSPTPAPDRPSPSVEPAAVAAESRVTGPSAAVQPARAAEESGPPAPTAVPVAETAPPVPAGPDPAVVQERSQLLAEIEQLRAEVERQRRQLEAEQLRRELESATPRPPREVAAAPGTVVGDDDSQKPESGASRVAQSAPEPRATPESRPSSEPRPAPAPVAGPAPRSEPQAKPRPVEPPARPGPRTLEFWNGLNALIAKESEMRRPPLAGLTALNAAEFLERRVAAGEFARQAIRALDDADVDAEAKNLAADLAAWYAEEASVAQQAQALLGASAEARRGTQGQRYQEAERRHNARVSELNRQAEQLRERLARRYGMKFPPLL